MLFGQSQAAPAGQPSQNAGAGSTDFISAFDSLIPANSAVVGKCETAAPGGTKGCRYIHPDLRALESDYRNPRATAPDPIANIHRPVAECDCWLLGAEISGGTNLIRTHRPVDLSNISIAGRNLGTGSNGKMGRSQCL